MSREELEQIGAIERVSGGKTVSARSATKLLAHIDALEAARDELQDRIRHLNMTHNAITSQSNQFQDERDAAEERLDALTAAVEALPILDLDPTDLIERAAVLAILRGEQEAPQTWAQRGRRLAGSDWTDPKG